MKDILEKILFNKEQLDKRIEEIAKELTEKFKNNQTPPVFVCILKGACVFFVDLIKKVGCNVAIDFMSVSSYGNGFESSGKVTIKKDVDTNLQGRDVVIVEDIVDSGYTMNDLIEIMKNKGAKSTTVVVLLDKVSRRKVQVQLDYVGFVIPDEFIVGYGLDYLDVYRNLPEVGVLKPEIYR